MRHLIEVKARYRDLNKAREILKEYNAVFIGKFKQVDIYYRVRIGRLKLRIIDGSKARLIYYLRQDIKEPKESKVLIYDVCGNYKVLDQILRRVLGVLTIVPKIREIYNLMDVEIHLDFVEGLGSFIEFEKETTAERINIDKQLMNNLISIFSIKSDDLIDVSYSDLMLKS